MVEIDALARSRLDGASVAKLRFMNTKVPGLAVLGLAGLLACGCAAMRNKGVEETTGHKVNDASIRFAVKSELANDPLLKDAKIEVETKDGVVTLNGEVDSQTRAKEAELAAGRAAGVTSVIDQLYIRRPKK